MAINPLCRNGEEIADYIGIGVDSIARFKEDHGLPVWKIDGKGKWKALKYSLDKWAVDTEKRHRGDSVGERDNCNV